MNTNLIEKMYEFKSNLRKETNELIANYNSLSNSDDKQILRGTIISKKEIYNEVKTELDMVKEAIQLYNSDPKNKQVYLNALAKLEETADKYEVVYKEIENEEKEVKVNKSEEKNRKSSIGKKLFTGLGLIGITAGVTSCINNTTLFESEEILSEEETNHKSDDINKYGMTSRFTDASNEKQVIKRAEDIYNKYININSIPETIKYQLSVEKLANVIRMFNGELPIENGKVSYNGETSLDEVANIFASYCNATSLEQYGTNLEFKPTCVFFTEGSLAHESSARCDEILEKIYSDIVARDINTFKSDAIKWGEFVRDTFVYNDFTGNTISIRSIDSEQQFPLGLSIISPYMPSIFEFALNTDLANRQGVNGTTFGICIPYCYNESNELEYIPLSKLIYDINYTPMNALAVRAGMESELENITDPIIIQSYNATQEFYKEKYNNEIGYSKQLK